MRRFDPEVFDSTKTPQQSIEGVGGRRDPYFERFSYDMYQSMSENPSALFNFFVENNDIFRKISQDDMRFMISRLHKRQEAMGWSGVGTLASVILYDRVLKKRIFETPRQPRFKLLTFGFKYLVLPWIATRAADRYMAIEDDFQKLSQKYNFGYDDFSSSMNILERAKILGLLDELQEQRGNFDFRKLESMPQK